MIGQFKKRIRTAWFNSRCRDIFLTSPVKIIKDNLAIVSMVCHKDLTMYLIAIKSLYHYLKQGEIFIVNDGTLTNSDINILDHHLSFPQIIDAKDINVGKCPKGGTWERLLFIADKAKDYYVVQIDADTLTIDDIPEAISCVLENRSFMIGNWRRHKVDPMDDYCESINRRNDNSTHVQVIAEKNFYKLKDYKALKYASGSSAFTGYVKGSFSREVVEMFSREMEEILGASKWSEWGSEQVAFNFIISNSKPSAVLPFPKYAAYSPLSGNSYNESSFLHFFGTYRFKSGFYIDKARGMIEKLMKIV